MALYKNSNAASPIARVEFTPMPDGNLSFFYLADESSKDNIKQFITSQSVGQEIVAETLLDGKPVLITRGEKTKEEMLKLLAERGDKLALQHPKKPFNFWALRGGLSFIGQTLHFASAVLGVHKLESRWDNGQLKNEDVDKLYLEKEIHRGRKNPHYNEQLAQQQTLAKEKEIAKNPELANHPELNKGGVFVRKPFAMDIGVFAVLNQTANIANMLYGGQEENGDNRLHAVKAEINQALGAHLAPGETPIDINENRATQRKEPPQPLTITEKLDAFARRYSVRFFEIGLRVLGTTALIVPWKSKSLAKGWGELRQGNYIPAVAAVLNPDKNYFWAGVCYMTGKILSFCGKVPDPYSDKPHTWLDTLREKWAFKAGTLVESGAAALMAHNAFFNKKFGFFDPDRADINPRRDYLSGIGGSSFFLGFVSRFFAPFGEKQVNMKEVYAHATDALAKTSQEKLPQLVADTAVTLKQHFKDKPMTFGELFTNMTADLYRYHQLPLNSFAGAPAAALAGGEKQKSTIAIPPSRRLIDRVDIGGISHAEKAKESAPLSAYHGV